MYRNNPGPNSCMWLTSNKKSLVINSKMFQMNTPTRNFIFFNRCRTHQIGSSLWFTFCFVVFFWKRKIFFSFSCLTDCYCCRCFSVELNENTLPSHARISRRHTRTNEKKRRRRRRKRNNTQTAHTRIQSHRRPITPAYRHSRIHIFFLLLSSTFIICQ